MTQAGVGTNRYAYSFNDPVNLSDPNGHDVLTGLHEVRQYRELILEKAEEHQIDPLGLASIVFQERYWGGFATAKDYATLWRDFTSNDWHPHENSSYGITQVNIGHVIRMEGLDPDAQWATAFAHLYLEDPERAMDYAAQYVAENEVELGIDLLGYHAAWAHNMGAPTYQKYLNGEIEIETNTHLRSVNFQDEIASALFDDYIDPNVRGYPFLGAPNFTGLSR